MEFKFNISDIFKQPVVEINNNLIPPGFSGDRRALWDTIGKVSEIVNAMGEASAAAQGLPKPITTAERLRNSEHKLYFLVDQGANNGKGAIAGMLKTGKKGLYVFDRDGQHYQVTPPCVLDFYVHESRQRTGLGKQLFEHMLQKEEVTPVKMAIDRPSEKLLGFLNKHYGLNSPVKQMNNYVVFDEFFPKSEQTSSAVPQESRSSSALGKKESANGLQKFSSPQGRYGAPRPPCSMGEIIHNQATNNVQEPTGVRSMPATNYQNVEQTGARIVSHDAKEEAVDKSQQAGPPLKLERPRSLSIQKSEDEAGELAGSNKDNNECNADEDYEDVADVEDGLKGVEIKDETEKGVDGSGSEVGDAVPSAKTASHLTNQGYFDIKFYHNKLW